VLHWLRLKLGNEITGSDRLHLEAASGKLAAVRELFENGTDVKSKDKPGRTALHWATSNGHEAVV